MRKYDNLKLSLFVFVSTLLAGFIAITMYNNLLFGAIDTTYLELFSQTAPTMFLLLVSPFIIVIIINLKKKVITRIVSVTTSEILRVLIATTLFAVLMVYLYRDLEFSFSMLYIFTISGSIFSYIIGLKFFAIEKE